MLQSCGKSTVRQAESLKDDASALAGSPRKNLQFESAASCCRGDGGCAAHTEAAETDNRQVGHDDLTKHSLHGISLLTMR